MRKLVSVSLTDMLVKIYQYRHIYWLVEYIGIGLTLRKRDCLLMAPFLPSHLFGTACRTVCLGRQKVQVNLLERSTWTWQRMKLSSRVGLSEDTGPHDGPGFGFSHLLVNEGGEEC